MKGLVLKEIYVCSGYFTFATAMMVVYSLFFGSRQMASVFGVLAIISPAMTSISYDENCKWNRYAGRLPVKTRRVVGVKYLDPFIWWCIMLPVATVIMTVKEGGLGPVFFMTMFTTMAIGIIYHALSLPALILLGGIKGRYAAVGLLMLPVVVVVLISNFLNINFDWVIEILGGIDFSGPGIYICFVAAALGLYLLSFGVTLEIYKRKQA